MESILNKLMMFVGVAMIMIGILIALMGITNISASHVTVGFVIFSAGIILSIGK